MKIAGSLFEPYLQWILLATVVLGALLGATTNMAGPLRYGYASHSDLFARFRSKIPAWSHLPVLVLAFHPWTSWWLLGTALCVAWQYVREQHREHVTLVTALADEACNRAQSFSALAQAESLAAERYERVAHALAANITRDARAAHHVRLTDFYIESAAAWSKLVDYMNTVKQAVGSARTLSHVARDLEAKVDKLDKPDDKVERGKMRNVAENCGEVLGLALDLESDGQRIQDKVDRFKRAAAKATQGRQMQAKAAAAAWTAATGITTEAKSAAEAAGSVTSHLGEVRDHAMDAKTAIATGRISAVQPALEKVASSLKLCGEKKDAAGQARKEVQAKMIGFSSTEFLDVVSDPDPEGEDSPVDADPDSDGASGDDE